MAFTIQRGTNISHWLSQSKRRGGERRAWFTQQDVRLLAARGFDHLRIPVDEEQLWDADGRPESEAFDLLDAALDWAEAAGMRAVVDLHILRSHYFNDKNEPALYRDPVAQETFCGLWRKLSDRLRRRSQERVAYELLNEAVARNDSDWNRVAMAAYDTVRAAEPERTIILGSNRFCSASTFDALTIPTAGPCILTFHYYSPMLITHYRASWWEGGVYSGPVQYPGLPVAPEDVAALDPDLKAKMKEWNQPHNRERMVADLAQPLAARARTGHSLYCGEFGVICHAPQEPRLNWYRDLIGVFREHGIAWANWDYKGGFGIVTQEGRDTGIADALLA